MKKIRDSDYAIILLTENYFRSSNCMFEMLEFLKEIDYPERIIPLIKKSSNIITDDGIIEYILYWKNKKEELQKKIEQIDYVSLGKLPEKLKHYEDICNSIAGIGDELNDKIPNMGNYNDNIGNETLNKSLSEELFLILNAQDEHFRMGFEDVKFNYGLLYKKLLFPNELFEDYLNYEKQKQFRELFDFYRTDDSLKLLFSFCEEYSLKKSIPVEYIKKYAIETLHKYF